MIPVAKCIKIVFYFMGVDGFNKATPKGGHSLDEYPANRANYIDGILQDHWIKHKVPQVTLRSPEQMSEYVGQTTVLFLMAMLMIKFTDISRTHAML
jgi:hypothetical protein